MMRFAALALVFATPAFAADLPAPAVAHAGDMLRDVNNSRLSSVDSVAKDGSIAIIFEGHIVNVPGSSLSMVNGKLTTNLSKAQISAM